MLAYNPYSSPNLASYSSFELVFGRKANIVPILEVTPPSSSYRYFETCQSKPGQETWIYKRDVEKIQGQTV